jgi:hypothetical protein
MAVKLAQSGFGARLAARVASAAVSGQDALPEAETQNEANA